MRRYEKAGKLSAKIISLIIAAAVFNLAWIPSFVYATETDSTYVTEGKYNFTSNELKNIQIEDHFKFREDCFMRSSFLGCNHLLELSAQLAISTASWYGEKIDPYEIDPSNNGRNAVNLLKSMGFEDVETNKYYTIDELEDSCAAAVGHRKISAFGEDYTLIAIAPRSAEYKQEWVGNFNVGSGDAHDGFKAARDEVLRYVKQYMKKHGIKGKLKIWTAGHSRGSAVANMVSGFFAGGGIKYFGDGVSITPEDVYAYCYAVPRTIKEGFEKNIELSVQGARAAYPNDTPGAAYTYSGGGKVNPDADVYGGIRNNVAGYDFITMMPPEEWGFTYYGRDNIIPLGRDVHAKTGMADEDDMAKELSVLSPFAYNQYTNEGGDHRKFSAKTFDLLELALADDASGGMPKDMDSFMKQRIVGLVTDAPTNAEYVSGKHEETLKAVAGLYGMILTVIDNPKEGKELQLTGALKPVILSYLAYASERLQDEGEAANDSEAAAKVIAGLLGFATGKDVDPSKYTVDNALEDIARHLADNSDSKLYNTAATEAEKALDGIDILGQKASDFLKSQLFEKYYVGGGEGDVSFRDALGAFVKAMVYGADENSEAYKQDESLSDPKNVRKQLYIVLGLALAGLEIGIDPADIIGPNNDGNVTLNNLAAAILPLLLTEKDGEGNVTKTYDTVAEAADALLPGAIDSLLADALELGDEVYTKAFMADVRRHVANLKNHVTEARRLLMNFFFYVKDEPYSVESDIRRAATFVGNTMIIRLAHYNEVYISWPRAINKLNCEDCDHYIKHVAKKAATCTKNGVREHWMYHESTGNRYFTTSDLSKELTAKDIIIAKHGHKWGPWKITKKATVNEKGEKTRTCEVCGATEVKPIAKLKPGDKDRDSSDPDDKKRGSLATGDENSLLIYMTMGSLAAAMLVLVVYRRRRKA
ncbi:MAG: hypothetical protein IJH57_05725 [Mogibacterium sp.]|nr:hypothetical protein [Mogibacterium sp.]